MSHSRVMIKIKAELHCITLHVVSRTNPERHDFLLHENCLIELEQKKYMTARDGSYYVTLRLLPAPDKGELLELDFSWISRDGADNLSGKEELIQVIYEKFKDSVRESYGRGGTYQNVLSVPGNRNPRIEFCSSKNLKEAVQNRRIRRKLGHFLGRSFHWPGTRKIRFYDDFEPYSFGFTEENLRGNRMYGAVILHGRKDLKKAYYQIHT